MQQLDFESEYNNRQRVPEHVEINARWLGQSEDTRAATKCDLDLSYGSGERQRYDLFHAASGLEGSPLAVFIHGGYWQRGDRKMYSFVARELVRRNVSVAVASYTLCPQTTVMGIVDELRQLVKALWETHRRRAVVLGNSAGGHLTAALLATDWSLMPDVPSDLVRAGYAISGIYDLAPLLDTTIGALLRLDPTSARAASPLFWPAPPKERSFVAAVGGQESQEFLRQSVDLAAAWSTAGVKAECVVVPDTNHFTIVDELARPDSAMLARVAAFAEMSAKD